MRHPLATIVFASIVAILGAAALRMSQPEPSTAASPSPPPAASADATVRPTFDAHGQWAGVDVTPPAPVLPPPQVLALVDAAAVPADEEETPEVRAALAEADAILGRYDRARWQAAETVATPAEMQRLIDSDDQARAEVAPFAGALDLRGRIELAVAAAERREDEILTPDRAAEMRAAIMDELTRAAAEEK